MYRAMQNERGIALAIAVFALVVIGALVAGAFFAGVQESRVGENTRFSGRAFNAAEAGVEQRLANWVADSVNTRIPNPGDSLVIAATNLTGGQGQYAGLIKRLNSSLFAVTINGTERAGASSRNVSRIGQLVMLRSATKTVPGAVTTLKAVGVSGAATINGNDVAPWADCPATGPAVPGITMKDSTKLTGSGSCTGPSWNCLNGSQKVKNAPAMDTTSVFSFSGLSWDQLAAMATITMPVGVWNDIYPRLSGTNCNFANTHNWGEPDRTQLVNAACFNYYPIIHLTGTGKFSFNGLRGQGLLLVDGDMEVKGGKFFGAVIVRGRYFSAGSSPGSITGALMTADLNSGGTNLTSAFNVNYSSCAVQRALSNVIIGAQRVRERSWATLF